VVDTGNLRNRAARDLDEHGFAIVADLVSSEDVAEVKYLLDGLFQRYDEFVTLKPSRGWRVAADMALATTPGDRVDQPEILHPSLLEPRLLQTALYRKTRAFIRSIDPLLTLRFDHAVRKNAVSEAETPWHQDYIYSNLTKLPSIFGRRRRHVWVPMETATIENGCLEFIPGSHRFGLVDHQVFERRSGYPSYIASPEAGAATTRGIVAAGGMTIHNVSTLHRAGVNRTSQARTAWLMQFGIFGAAEQWLMKASGKVPIASNIS